MPGIKKFCFVGRRKSFPTCPRFKRGPSLQEKIEVAVAKISAAIEQFDPIKVYALVSGGNDSTVTGHLALRQGLRVDAFVHINTGIGVEQTREYVREFSEWLETPLNEKFAPRTYEELVLKYGFPGPAAHRYMYSWLKERVLRQVGKEAQDGQNR
ncbi:MAG: phosphoadenosine phosphosulfate reductase family protein [Chloroflexi bacterium]|nr:phosphoadenosine phosphosulfate reductase family protein [Chloroflexota bacterium]